MAIPDPRRLLGMVSGMIVWAVWFILVYALTGVGCRAGWNRWLLPGGNLLGLSMLASTLSALALIGWCAWRGHAAWRSSRIAGAADGGEPAQRRRFMGLAMLLLSGLAGIGTLLVAVPMLMLDPCTA